MKSRIARWSSNVAASRLLAATLILVGAASAAPAQPEAPQVRIGIVVDGPASVNTLVGRVQQEILTLAEGEFDVRFDDGDVLIGDWTREVVEANIEVLLEDPEIDLVIALGAVASHAFCCREELPKPVIAAIVIDRELQDLPYDNGRSGVRNLNYLAFPESLERDLERFREIVPFTHLTLVFNRWFTSAVEGISDHFVEVIAEQGLDFDTVFVGSSVDEALAQIPDDTEAVYLAPLLHLSDPDRQRFIDGLHDRRLPTFSLFGVDEVERFGVFAAQRTRSFWDRLARRIALNVQRILLGEDAGTIPVAIADRQRLTIDMATARKIDVFPPWDLLTEAELRNEAPAFARTWSLEDAAREAIRANLDVAAKGREVAAGAQAVTTARAALRPQAGASAGFLQIDDDRASTLAGQAERSGSAGLHLSQLIFSDPARANVAVQGDLQMTREQELEELRLDVAREAAVTYLNVLLAQTVEKIRKNNLELTRSNLELARVRQAVGYAGPGEVYRWESEVATARRNLVEAWSDRFQAKIALNRLLHRPLEEGYATAEVLLDDPSVMPSREQLLPYIVTPRHFEVFREFSVEEGLSRAPELRQVEHAIAAQERVLKSARRTYWSPEAALRLELDERLFEGGEGSGGGAIPGFTVPDDTSWSFALQASLPLWQGGARRAEVIAAEETLGQLTLQRDAVRERLEQRIRSRLYVVNSSYAGIRYTREASEAAGKNLELVTDAYSRGAVDVLDLLDAQNAALLAELDAATARYRFFIDLIDVERSLNWFNFLRSREERDAWYERLSKWFDDHGLKPQPQLVRY